MQNDGHVKKESSKEDDDTAMDVTRDDLSLSPPPSEEEAGSTEWPPADFNSLHPVALPFGPRSLDKRMQLAEQVGAWGMGHVSESWWHCWEEAAATAV